MTEKKKILLISDMPLISSGVGTQAKYLIEGLLDTGKYKFVCLGGAIKHQDYTPLKIAPEKYGDDWIIFPVDGYGNKDVLRKALISEKPNALLIITDPRFYTWLWEMEDEVRSVCPLLYWHVWDNDPTPRYNKGFYDSTDFIGTISLKTHGLLQDLNLDKNKFSYIPHALPKDLFKPLPEEHCAKFKRDFFGMHADKKFIAFWNNRNARRKQTGDVIASFAAFAKKVGKENVAMLMHTNVHDVEGQDIMAVANCYGIESNLICSEDRVNPEMLNDFYNACDCTINIASNEGFGLATLESLHSGTPIIVHMTGGLQFQIGDWWHDTSGNVNVDLRNQDGMTEFAKKCWNKKERNWWGIPVFPASRSCTGSQQIPYIYDDRVRHEDVINALLKLYNMGRNKRKELGEQAREWVIKMFDLPSMINSWDIALQSCMGKKITNNIKFAVL